MPGRARPSSRPRRGSGSAVPVGSGKTALIERLIPLLHARGVDLAVVTNDLVTHEDAERVRRSGLIDPARVVAVEAGACPHTVIREDPTLNIAAGDALEARFPGLELIIFESGGDNLASTFSLDLVDWWIFVIDVAGGDDIPRKRGPGVIRSDLLVVNKVDLAPHVGSRPAAHAGRGLGGAERRPRGGDRPAPRRGRGGGGRRHLRRRAVQGLRCSTALDRPVGPSPATLRFARGGGRTFLKEQRTPYPFHTTRPHYLDADRPDLATLYLQSASGGLYRGDRLELCARSRPGRPRPCDDPGRDRGPCRRGWRSGAADEDRCRGRGLRGPDLRPLHPVPPARTSRPRPGS